MNSQTNSANNTVPVQVELQDVEPAALNLDTLEESSEVLPAQEGVVLKTVSEANKTDSTDSATIPVGKIVVGILALDALWTLICSVTPTVVVYQAAVLANTNPILVVMATLTSFLAFFVSNFLFNLFIAICATFVFGGGALTIALAFSSIFGKKQ